LGLADQVSFLLANACATGLPGQSADFVWGEDAWCYVVDKPGLIAEAVRLVKPGGRVAFTDWVEGPAGLSEREAERFLTFMKFPNLQDLDGYPALLRANGCEVQAAQDTGRFAPYVDLYLDMLNKQLTYDALRIIGFDQGLMRALGQEMTFMQQLAHEGKLAQGLFIAMKSR
jgi:SAM-dependent methyltransferase